MKKYHQYDEIKKHYRKNDLIESLSDGKTYKYSGMLTLGSKGYDSLNEKLVVYDKGKFAKVIEIGIDTEKIEWDNHITKVLETCKRLGCTPSELLKKDYLTELGYNK